MKIETIAINGFKKLQQFAIDPAGKSVEIKGKNGQGKSSIIDAIWCTLTGKVTSAWCGMPWMMIGSASCMMVPIGLLVGAVIEVLTPRKPRPSGTGRSGPGWSAAGLGDQVGVAPGGIPALAAVEGGAAIGGVLVAGDASHPSATIEPPATCVRHFGQ